MQDPTQNLLPRTVTVLSAVPIALAAVVICGYQFGVEDQAQYLVHLERLIDPSRFPGDPYLGAFGSLGSVFWHLFRFVPSADRPAVFLTVHVAIAIVNAVLLAMTVRPLLPAFPTRFIGRRIALALGSATPALLLVVPKELNWFGIVSLADRELTATYAVLPFVFAAMMLYSRGRPFASLVPCLLALPVQGQTGIYLCSTWLIAMLITNRHDRRARSLLAGAGVVSAIAAMVVAVRSRLPASAADAYNAVGEGLYPELIDPTSAPLSSWGVVAAIVVMGAGAAWQLRTLNRPDIPERIATTYGALVVWGVASCVFPIVGVLAHLVGIDEPFLARLMVGRALMLPQVVSIVLLGAWATHALRRPRPVAWIVASGVLLLIAMWPFPWLSMPVSAVTVIAICLSVRLVRPHDRVPGPGAVGRLVGVMMILAIAVLARGIMDFSRTERPWLRSAEAPAWLDVQQWAALNTETDARFVTPPYLSGWRVGSRRSTFGEVKDGCLLFYAGTPAVEWADRMGRLGMTAPYAFVEADGVAGAAVNHGPPLDLDELRAAYADAVGSTLPDGIRYVVTERNHDVDVGTPVFENDGFVVRHLSTNDEP